MQASTAEFAAAPGAYRPDIDGLRAIAVVAVIVYHFAGSILPGGFLGVDVFFVLSGYLITSILSGEADDKRLSIRRFYGRRVRRIAPALLTVMLASTIAACVLLLPNDLLGYARSLLSSLAFVANFYFWRDTNYFAPLAAYKPLLHLWSLSVEEQFYLFYPLLFALVARFWRRGMLLVLALVALGSLLLNIAVIKVGGSSPAFFLLPTRAWELAVGAIVAVGGRRSLPGWVSEAAAVAGLLLIVDSLWRGTTYWMLPIAVPAVVGTALVVWAGQGKAPLVSQLVLSSRPVVLVGLMSYSLYLWHWPIWVFTNYYFVDGMGPWQLAADAVLTVVLSYASWRFVERPFRNKVTPFRIVGFSAVVAAAALVVAAGAVTWGNGLPQRFSGEAAVLNSAVDTIYRCPVSEYLVLGTQRACVMNLPTRNPDDAQVVLLGNSHAQMYAPLVGDVLAELHEPGILVAMNGCLPTVTVNVDTDCIAAAQANLDEVLKLHSATTVIIGTTWPNGARDLVAADGSTPDNSNAVALQSGLDDLIDKLHVAGKSVALIGPIAEPGWDIASVLSRAVAFGRTVPMPLSLAVAEFDKQFGAVIGHFAARNDIAFIRPDQIQCAGGQCAYVIDGRALFSDSNHFATPELGRFRAAFMAALSGSATSASR